MWIIITIVGVLIVVTYSAFSKSVDSSVNNFERDKWWTIGMIADMHNKRNKNK